jgi:hypothetical protein
MGQYRLDLSDNDWATTFQSRTADLPLSELCFLAAIQIQKRFASSHALFCNLGKILHLVSGMGPRRDTIFSTYRQLNSSPAGSKRLRKTAI